jgi:solute carrier family 25 carnitine/acylcarnitine transporter 20/29
LAPVASQQAASSATASSTGQPVWWKHFVAGNAGGIFGLTIVYPLDTVKVRIQTRPRGTYTGIIHCLTSTVKNEGLMSLYRGIASPVLGYGLIKSVAFGSYNYAKDQITARQQHHATQLLTTSGSVRPVARIDSELSLGTLVACGAFAGAAQTMIRVPVEQIKVVMQARNRVGSTTAAPYRSTFHCLIEVLRTEGLVQGLYRSFWPTLWREIPQYAIYYPAYEVCKKLMQTSTGQQELTPLYTAIAGGLAGVSQWVPTYPLDVLKSKVSAAPPGTYKGTLDCLRVSVAQEGPMVLWRGLSASVVRAFPLHGAVFVGYEIAIKLLK